MRPHPSRETLVDFEELTGRRSRRVSDHLAACSRCRARLAELRSLRIRVARAIHTDRAPDVWTTIEHRLDHGPPVILPVPDERARDASARPSRRHSVAAAAVGVLITAGLATAAVRLTPLGSFLARDADHAAVDVLREQAPEAGVELDVPADGLTLELDASDDLRLVVSMWEGEQVALTATSRTDPLVVRVGAGQALITGEAGTLRVRAPVLAIPIRIVARGVTLAVVRDGTIRTVGDGRATSLDASLGTLLRASSGRDAP